MTLEALPDLRSDIEVVIMLLITGKPRMRQWAVT